MTVLNYEAANHSTTLLISTDAPPPVYAEKSDVLREKVGDHGFRKAITTLYDHRYTLCGIKTISPEDHTIVDAAHIIPWSRSHDDRPTNGKKTVQVGRLIPVVVFLAIYTNMCLE